MTETEFKDLHLLDKLWEKGYLTNGKGSCPKPRNKQKTLDFLQSEVGIPEPFTDIKEVLFCTLHGDFPLNHKCPVCGKRLYFISLNGDDRYNKFCSKECGKVHTVEGIYNSVPPKELTEKFHEDMSFEEFSDFCKENIFKNGNSPKTQKLRAHFKYFSERLTIAKNWRSINEFMWCVINNDSEEHRYCECGNEVTFSEVAGRRKTCGNKDCAEKYAHTEESYNKRHQTCLEKYGVEHFSKTEDYKQKYQATSMERYGAPSFMSNKDQREKSFQRYYEKTGYPTPLVNPQSRESAKISLQKHLEIDPELQVRAGRKAIETYRQKDPTEEKRKQKAKQTRDKHVAENPNFWREIRSQALETGYKKAGSKEAYNRQVQEKRNERAIKEYGSLENFYAHRDSILKQNNLKKWGYVHYMQTPEYKEWCRKETERLFKEFRENNPTIYPLTEISNMLSDIFSKYSLTFTKQEELLKESLKILGIPCESYNYSVDGHGYGNIYRKFFGCNLENKEDFITSISPILEEQIKKYLSESFRSEGEKELFEYIQSLVGEEEVISNDRTQILSEKGSYLELDIYIPTRKLAFEYNGTYWHSLEIVKDKYYHLNKTQKCAELGIGLIHIWDYEWLFETEKVKTLIKTILLSKTKVSARKCTIARITPHEEEEFLNTYHYEGYKESLVCYGLYYDNTLVQVMSLSKPEDNVAQYELLRLCTKTDLIILGGAERMFKHFLFDYNPESVVSYCDRDKFSGGIYGKLNFSSESWRPIESLIKVENGEYHRITESQINELNWVEINNLDKDNYCDIYNSGRETYVWKR